MALIHTIKTLEYPLPVFSRYPNTGILYGKLAILNGNIHLSTMNIIFNGIIAEIIDDFIQKSSDTLNAEPGAVYAHGNVLFRCAGFQNNCNLFTQFQKIHFLCGKFNAFIQLRQPDDIFHEIDKTGCFLVSEKSLELSFFGSITLLNFSTALL